MLYVIDIRLIDVFIKLFDCACMTNLFQSKSQIKKFTAKESFWTKMSIPIRMEVIIALEKKKRKTIPGWRFSYQVFFQTFDFSSEKIQKRKKRDLKKQRKKKACRNILINLNTKDIVMVNDPSNLLLYILRFLVYTNSWRQGWVCFHFIQYLNVLRFAQANRNASLSVYTFIFIV